MTDFFKSAVFQLCVWVVILICALIALIPRRAR